MGKETSESNPGAGRDEDTGQFTETYPLDAFVDAIREMGGEAGTKAVAERIGCSYETAYKKLQTLKDAGEVDHRQVGNAYLWEVGDG